LDRKVPADEVDVDPAQGKKLSTSGAGGGGECEIKMEGRVVSDGFEQSGHLDRRGRPHLDRLAPRRAGMVGHVVEDP
jgi:hypothetical protein